MTQREGSPGSAQIASTAAVTSLNVPGQPPTRHTDVAVFDDRDVVPGGGETLCLGGRMGAVELLLPEPAVDDDDRRAGGLARREPHVIDLLRVAPYAVVRAGGAAPAEGRPGESGVTSPAPR